MRLSDIPEDEAQSFVRRNPDYAGEDIIPSHPTYANLRDEERAGLDAREPEQQTAYDRGYMAGFIAAQRVTAEAVRALPFDVRLTNSAVENIAYQAAIDAVLALIEDKAAS